MRVYRMPLTGVERRNLCCLLRSHAFWIHAVGIRSGPAGCPSAFPRWFASWHLALHCQLHGQLSMTLPSTLLPSWGVSAPRAGRRYPGAASLRGPSARSRSHGVVSREMGRWLVAARALVCLLSCSVSSSRRQTLVS